MAAVAVSPAQYNLGMMSNRRAPLSSVPNAVNSPYRVAAASKRSRQQADQENVADDLQPPNKKQAFADRHPTPRTPPQQQPIQRGELRIFSKRAPIIQPTAFERKLLEAKEKRAIERRELAQEPKVERQGRNASESLEVIRQWQKHYRKVFPTFVFYFESISDESRARHAKFIRAFGAREEKFFSKEVTHIVTSRAIPADGDLKGSTDVLGPNTTSSSSQNTAPPPTINPSVLESTTSTQSQVQALQAKHKLNFNGIAGKRVPSNGLREAELKRSLGNTDILQRAKDMGIKIWPMEKLERISRTMLDKRTDEISQPGAGNRNSVSHPGLASKTHHEADLSHLLRNEQLNGLSDASTLTGGTIPFRGPHIYVRCMDEKTKPILVKEFPRVANRNDGDWPQFRGNSAGKCPFVVDNSLQQHDLVRQKTVKEEVQNQECPDRRRAPRTRAATAAAANISRSREPSISTRREPLADSGGRENAVIPLANPGSDQADCPSPLAIGRPRSPQKAPSNAPTAIRPRYFNGEPAASGMQPSNITSAIRSQMISSTAAQPGAKAGTSKEVHGLKRKVLEKNSAPALTQFQRSYRSIDPLGAARAERHIPIARQTRRQAQERLVHIDEESTQSEDDEDVWRTEEVRRKHIVLDEAPKKPGYCENCRDKYDDFDTHIRDRKHRKFALTQENWTDLDNLLSQLGRPLKEAYSDGL